MKIGDAIKKIRKEKGISQKQLAQTLNNMPVSTLANYENNHREPNLENLDKIAAALDISLSDLLDNQKSIDVTNSDKDTIEFLDGFSFDNPRIYDVVTFLKKFDYIVKAKPYENTYLISIYKDKKLLVTVKKIDFEEQATPLIKLAHMAQNKADSFVNELNFLCGFHTEE